MQKKVIGQKCKKKKCWMCVGGGGLRWLASKIAASEREKKREEERIIRQSCRGGCDLSAAEGGADEAAA